MKSRYLVLFGITAVFLNLNFNSGHASDSNKLTYKMKKGATLNYTMESKNESLQEVMGSEVETNEASGSPSGFSIAMQLVRPRGTLVLKSTYNDDLEMDAAPIVIDEITIIGSRCGPFEPAIKTLENNLVKVEDLIDQTYPFSQALRAFEHAKQRDSLKIILDFDE